MEKCVLNCPNTYDLFKQFVQYYRLFYWDLKLHICQAFHINILARHWALHFCHVFSPKKSSTINKPLLWQLINVQIFDFQFSFYIDFQSFALLIVVVVQSPTNNLKPNEKGEILSPLAKKKTLRTHTHNYKQLYQLQ